MNNKLQHVFLTGFLFLFSLIPILWFPGSTLLLGYDNVYPLNPLPFLLDRTSSWSSMLGFGSDQSGMQGSLLIHTIDALPQFIGFSHQASQKIVFTFWFFLLLLSPYLLIRRLMVIGFIKSPYVQYFFPLLYAVNFYTLQAWWIAERTKFSLLVATPLILAVLLPTIKKTPTIKQSIFYGFVCALILSIFNGGGWAGLSLFGGLLIVLFCFFALQVVTGFVQKNYRKIGTTLLLNIVFGISFLLLNAYTFLPFLAVTFSDYSELVQRTGGTTAIIGWTRYLSEHTSTINLIRLQGIPDWYNTTFHPYANDYLRNPLLIFISFTLAASVFLALFFRERFGKQLTVYFLFVLILSLFLSAGSHKPLGFLFELLMEKIPGFLIFRSAIFKFGYAFWLAASLFISLFVSEFTVRSVKKLAGRNSAILSTIIAGLVMIGILVYHKPFLTGDFFRVDTTSLSRVTLPEYVSEFSSWWHGVGEDQRILMLPRLNSNWHFETYDWQYLSLNPVLANFGNEGLIENTVLLTPSEKAHLDSLYQAINESDEEASAFIAQRLGIGYFLLRKDFASDRSGMETDNPQELEKILATFSNLSRINSFGPWDVYAFENERSLFHVASSAVASDNPSAIMFANRQRDEVWVQLAFANDVDALSQIHLTPECVSCQGERETTPVVFPEPRILMDSNLYQLILLRERLIGSQPVTFDDRLFFHVGETLRYAGQLRELIERDRGEYYVNLAREKFIVSLNDIEEMTASIPTQSSNPYSTAIIIQNYLREEREFLRTLALRTNKREQQLNLEWILASVGRLETRLREIFSEEDFNREKTYAVSVSHPGRYEVLIDRDSLGSLVDLSTITLVTKASSLSANVQEDNKIVSFGQVNLDEGKHEFVLLLSPQRNVLTLPVFTKRAGRSCIESSIEGFSRDSVYSFSFSVKNNFDPQFLFFADDATVYEPRLLEYFPVAGEQVKTRRFILSTSTVPMKETAKTIRVGFCAPSLTWERFYTSISDMQAVPLTSPAVTLVQTSELPNNQPPTIQVTKNNAFSYAVEVKNATDPFYLSFLTRNSPSWKASEGLHLIGDNYNNTWYVDREGEYTITLTYDSQKYFYSGLAISLSTLFALFGFSVIGYARKWF